VTLDEYQKEAMRTAAMNDSLTVRVAVLALGLTGEAGEVAEHIKKWLGHGHGLDMDKVRKELGDVLWYVATLSATLNIQLDEVAAANVVKLRARYPEGFSSEASRNRKEGGK
jgi:NTP pyrophosphatase (non-canonical NTP hydrolase)